MEPLPNEFENLQSVYIRTYNRVVRQGFRDGIEDDDFSTPEGQMKRACLIQDNDSALQMLLRINLFYIVRGEAKQLHPPIYEMPISDNEPVMLHPQVILKFQEDSENRHRRENRILKNVRVSFRMMDENTSTITQTEIDRLQRNIARLFPRDYKFKTGRYKVSYLDEVKGYRLILTPYSKAIGERLIEKVLSIRDHNPEWSRLSISEQPRRNFNTQEYTTILNERRRLPKPRSIAECFLKKATLKLHGHLAEIPLYETY